jgi:hypothetical protein
VDAAVSELLDDALVVARANALLLAAGAGHITVRGGVASRQPEAEHALGRRGQDFQREIAACRGAAEREA